MSDYAVRITRLNYTYPDGTKALEGIDLDVACGERIAVVGPSGAGKSTLLLHLNGVLEGTGSIKIMGLPLQESNLQQIRKQVGLLFQDPNDQLFCPTVYEDIAFGPMNLGVPAGEIPRRVEKALNDSGLDHSFRSRSSHHLSLGERRRVSLATILAMEPVVLGMDEPTSNLDPRNRRHLIEVISGLQASQIIATHDLEFVVEVCSRAVVMDRGKIWADGETKAILSDSRLMEAHGLEVPLSLKCGGRA
ncbi:MAG: ABC transporter ATP-binding protein [Acidobacteriota bacterium]|jgi:cobalt/nickel transport system ATP-binding protein|nr:ABC transporter ATP-binding protein [Acidobacteriota bacterium]